MRVLNQMQPEPGEGTRFGGIDPGTDAVKDAIARAREAVIASRVREESRQRGLAAVREQKRAETGEK